MTTPPTFRDTLRVVRAEARRARHARLMAACCPHSAIRPAEQVKAVERVLRDFGVPPR